MIRGVLFPCELRSVLLEDRIKTRDILEYVEAHGSEWEECHRVKVHVTKLR